MPNGTSLTVMPKGLSGTAGGGTPSSKQNEKGRVFTSVMQKVTQSVSNKSATQRKDTNSPILGKVNDPSLTLNKMDPATKLMTLLNELEKTLKNQKDPKISNAMLKQLSTLQQLLGHLLAGSSSSQNKILPVSLGKSADKTTDDQKMDMSKLLQNVDQFEAAIMPLLQFLINSTGNSEQSGTSLLLKGNEKQGLLASNAKTLTQLKELVGKTIQELEQIKKDSQITPLTASTKTKPDAQGKINTGSPSKNAINFIVKPTDQSGNHLAAQSGKTTTAKPDNPIKSSIKMNTQIYGFQTGPMNKLQQLTFHQPKSATPVPVNQQIIQQISDYLGKNGIQTLKNGSQQLTITLHPASLGEVTITLSQDPNGIIAKIITAEAGTKDLIQSQLQQLNQGLQSQQIPVHKIEVGQNAIFNSQTQQQPFQQSHHEDNRDQQQEQHYIEHSEDVLDDTGQTFEEWLRGGTVNEY